MKGRLKPITLYLTKLIPCYWTVTNTYVWSYGKLETFKNSFRKPHHHVKKLGTYSLLLWFWRSRLRHERTYEHLQISFFILTLDLKITLFILRFYLSNAKPSGKWRIICWVFLGIIFCSPVSPLPDFYLSWFHFLSEFSQDATGQWLKMCVLDGQLQPCLTSVPNRCLEALEPSLLVTLNFIHEPGVRRPRKLPGEVLFPSEWGFGNRSGPIQNIKQFKIQDVWCIRSSRLELGKGRKAALFVTNCQNFRDKGD